MSRLVMLVQGSFFLIWAMYIFDMCLLSEYMFVLTGEHTPSPYTRFQDKFSFILFFHSFVNSLSLCNMKAQKALMIDTFFNQFKLRLVYLTQLLTLTFNNMWAWLGEKSRTFSKLSAKLTNSYFILFIKTVHCISLQLGPTPGFLRHIPDDSGSYYQSFRAIRWNCMAARNH